MRPTEPGGFPSPIATNALVVLTSESVRFEILQSSFRQTKPLSNQPHRLKPIVCGCLRDLIPKTLPQTHIACTGNQH